MSRRTTSRKPKPKGFLRSASADRPAGQRAGLFEAGNRAASEIIGRMEQSVGEDLSGVEIHASPQAAELAGALGAEAFTCGEQIFLGKSAPSLNSDAGQRLLAHELTHVVQQRRASTVDTSAVGDAGGTFERAADRTASLAMQGQSAPVTSGGSAPGVQRQAAAGTGQKEETVGTKRAADIIRAFLEHDELKTPAGYVDLKKARAQLLQLAQAPPVPPRADTRAEIATKLELLLNSSTTKTPKDLADAVAGKLPSPFPMSALNALHVPSAEPKKSTFDKVVDKVAQGPDRTGPPPLTADSSPGPQDRSAYGEFVAGKAGTAPTVAPVPISDIVNLAQGDPKKPKPKPKQDTPKPEVVEPPPPSSVKPDIITGADPAATPVPPKESPQQGLGALPSFVESVIAQAQADGKTTADISLADSMRAQQAVVFRQVQHLLQKNAMAKGRVTAVNVYFGGKLDRTVLLPTGAGAK